MTCAALLVALWRLWRGESVKVLLGVLVVVAIYAVLGVLTGQGRGFFLGDLLRQGLLFTVFGGSLLSRRPISRLVDRTTDPWLASLRNASGAAHTTVTLAWTALWGAHLALSVPLYLEHQVWVLGVVHFLLGPPPILLLGWWSTIRLRRGAERDLTGGCL